MDPMMKYPRLRDLEPAARRRIPPFIFAYLDSGTGHDVSKAANTALYDRMALTPQFLRGRVDPDLTVSLLGKRKVARLERMTNRSNKKDRKRVKARKTRKSRCLRNDRNHLAK